MDVHVLVTTAGPEQPVAGLPVTVEVRDTSLLDVPSTTVCSASTVTGDLKGAPKVPHGQRPVAALVLSVPDNVSDASSLTVWARVASHPQDHVVAGDWITVQAYPVQSQTVVVDVVPV